jgi:hypothetical protein
MMVAKPRMLVVTAANSGETARVAARLAWSASAEPGEPEALDGVGLALQPRKCHELETDHGDIVMRQPRRPRSRTINMSRGVRPYKPSRNKTSPACARRTSPIRRTMAM